MSSKKISTREDGMTLIEVLVATLVVGIAILGVAMMFSTGQSLVVVHGDERVAIFLAQQRIEQIRASGFGSAVATPNPTNATDPAIVVTEDPVPNHPRYQRTITILCVNPADFTQRVDCTPPTPALAKRITATVQTTPVDPKVTPVTLQAVMVSR